ncbi:MAG: carbon storage regulator [Isosphaeraceae bacterium]|nr:carbon storage regulator [Isosphaeraceae bacterium]
MLVLSRKRLQSVLIGPDIRVTVVRVDGGHVRLGIEAPSQVPVIREELLCDAEERAAWPAAPAAEEESAR